MSSGSAKPWLRRVGLAAVDGMSDREVSEHGFQIMLDAMRGAYHARYPAERARYQAWQQREREGGA